MGDTDFLPQSAQDLNAAITVSALIVAASQIIFFVNVIWSLKSGKPSGPNPWGATSLEWQTPDTPPKHGNWGHDLPVVYRWAYDYSVPGYPEDFIPQNMPPEKAPVGRDHGIHH
jgi:cytochrome c oxidase subunit 1